MFGYVRPSLPKLTEEDKRRFRAAYCGLCRALGERYGLPARFILNYDLTFLAVLLWPPDTGSRSTGAVSPIRWQGGTLSRGMRPWSWRRMRA